MYADGELLPSGSAARRAHGETFSADALDFDDDVILSDIAEELPDATISEFGVVGGPEVRVQYVGVRGLGRRRRARRAAGPDGAVLGRRARLTWVG